METKDVIAITGITSTFLVSCATLGYSLWSNKRSVFVNTVTNSRLKWIESLRDKVAEFIAVTTSIEGSGLDPEGKSIKTLSLERDTLLHQIVLHLNPHDPEDQKIKIAVDYIHGLTSPGKPSAQLASALVELREVTADYLKKEWNKVKYESGGRSGKSKWS